MRPFQILASVLSCRSGISRLWVLLPLLIVGCAQVVPVRSLSAIPQGEYDVQALVVFAPTKVGTGEMVEAVLFTRPGGPPVTIMESPFSGYSWMRPLGKGKGVEAAAPVVRDMANYETVALMRGGETVGYALIHRPGVTASTQEWGKGVLLVLANYHFLDQDYIWSKGDGGVR